MVAVALAGGLGIALSCAVAPMDRKVNIIRERIDCFFILLFFWFELVIAKNAPQGINLNGHF
jgi:hypothetical protein